MIDEQKLRGLAEAATPLSTELYGDRYFHGDYSKAELTKEQDAFFTAANPATILALLDELQSLRSERTAWRVTAENAEEDAARYRWLRGQHWQENRIGVVIHPKDQTKLGSFLPSGSLLDDAIDHMSTTDSAIDVTEETP